MSKILDGKKLSDQLIPKLKKQVNKLKIKPKLVIIQIGNLEESNIYIKKKKIFAHKIGVLVLHKKYSNNVPEKKVITDIIKVNLDSMVHGVMVQLPLPKHLNASKIIEAINPDKDVDGLTAKNTKLLFDNDEAFLPATTKGIITLLENYKINLVGKKVVVVGESMLVGRPTALAFVNRGATVTICHSQTKNLAEETQCADILLVAIGVAKFISTKHVSPNQIVIDVGINYFKKGVVVGDVNFEKVKNIVGALTPVPGGVGPMTVLSLFNNLIKAYILQTNSNIK